MRIFSSTTTSVSLPCWHTSTTEPNRGWKRATSTDLQVYVGRAYAARYRNEDDLPLELKNNCSRQYSYSWLSDQLGMQADVWDRHVRSYCCSLLSDLISFKVTEKEQSFSDSEEACSKGIEQQRQKPARELQSVQEDQDEFLQSMRHDLLFPTDPATKKLLATVDFDLILPKTECHIKRYLGETYKKPMVISLLSIPGKRLLGAKVSLFKPESLSTKSYLLPISFTEQFCSAKTASFIQAFKEHSGRLTEDHLVVSQDHNLDARRAPGDNRLYSFLFHQQIPFEMLLIWSAHQMWIRKDTSLVVASALSSIAKLKTFSVNRSATLAGSLRKIRE